MKGPPLLQVGWLLGEHLPGSHVSRIPRPGEPIIIKSTFTITIVYFYFRVFSNFLNIKMQQNLVLYGTLCFSIKSCSQDFPLTWFSFLDLDETFLQPEHPAQTQTKHKTYCGVQWSFIKYILSRACPYQFAIRNVLPYVTMWVSLSFIKKIKFLVATLSMEYKLNLYRIVWYRMKNDTS